MPTDLDRLQGTWRVTSLETDGQQMAPNFFDGAMIVITGNRFTSVGMGGTYEGTIELDTSKKLNAFDLVFTAGPPEGTRNRGIYQLEGNRWRICLATRGDGRPRSFATKPGTGFALETLERDDGKRPPKTAKEPATRTARGSATKAVARPVASAVGSPTELEGEWQMVSGVFNGKPLDQSMVKWCKRVTQGNVTAVIAGPQTMLKARFTLDPSRTPAAIDYVNLEGASRGKGQAGIYELKDGILRVCMAAPRKPRPTAFESLAGDGRSFTTWRADKP